MKKFKTFIVEDQKGPLKRLLGLLKAYPNVIDLDSIHVARSFFEAQNVILNGECFDLSILDKNLGGGKTCFNLITKENKHAFGIITLNSIDENSQKHFEEISLLSNYLVLRKPYNKEDVADLIERLRAVKLPEEEATLNTKPILLKENSREFPVSQNRIVYIEVDDNYCYIFYMINESYKKYVIAKQLKHYESILNKKIFFRISDKHLLNIDFVQELNDGKIKLNIKFNNEEIFLPLSEKNKKGFLSFFTK